MSDNYLEIESFLQEMQLLKNKDITKFTSMLVYQKLTILGVYANEINIKTKQWYPIWNATFKKLKNIDVINTNGKNFKIRNLNTEKEIDKEKYLTVYLSFHRSHFNQCFQKLVLFLNKKNIKHELFVNFIITNNCIKLNLINLEDLQTIKTFLNSDNLFISGIMKPNPFIPTEDNISIVKEGIMDYNLVLSNYIVSYIKDEKENVNIKKFLKYLENIYQKTFINGYDLTVTAYIQNIEYDFENEIKYYQKIFDCKYITEIILKMLKGIKDLKKFVNNIYNNNKSNNINELCTFYRKKEIVYHQTIYELSKCIEQNIKIVGLHNTMNALKMYVEGSPCGFTKKNNIRNNLIEKVDLQILKYILSGLEPGEYVKKEAYNLGLIKEKVKKTYQEEFIDDLIQGLILTYQKYLKRIDKKKAHLKLIKAIELIKEENFLYITNDYQIRKKLILISKKIDLKYIDKIIYEYLLESNVDIESENDTLDTFVTLIEDLSKSKKYPMINNY